MYYSFLSLIASAATYYRAAHLRPSNAQILNFDFGITIYEYIVSIAFLLLYVIYDIISLVFSASSNINVNYLLADIAL